jgi:hypothetical protein
MVAPNVFTASSPGRPGQCASRATRLAPFVMNSAPLAAYLTTLTATPTRHRGKTPFELWFGRRPSLAHLREIGCRAFVLIQSNNPKIYRFSTHVSLLGSAGQLGVLDAICRIFINVKISTCASDGHWQLTSDISYLGILGGQELMGVHFDIWGGP